MKNNLIYGVHIFESDLANELDSIVEDAYHYGATEAEIRSLIDTFRKETVRTALEKEIFLTLRLAILWQYGWLRPEEVAPLQQLVQKGVSKKWLQQFGTDIPQMSYAKRQQQVVRLLSRLATANTAVPAREYWQKVTDFLFVPYEVLSVPLLGGQYGAVWLLRTDNYEGDGHYTFVELLYKSTEKPTMESLMEARLQLMGDGEKEVLSDVRRVSHKALLLFAERLERIGTAIPKKSLPAPSPYIIAYDSFEKFVQRWNSDTGIPDKRKRKKFKSVVAHW